MKQLVSAGKRKTALIEVEEPMITAPNEIKVKLTGCGVCMSEHFAWSEHIDNRPFGHEPIGVITEVGADVTYFKVGDRVSGGFSGSAEYAVVKQTDAIFKLPDTIGDIDGVLEPLACLVSAVTKMRMTIIGDTVAVVGCGYMGCGAISLLKKRGYYVVGIDIREESLKNALRYGADEVYTPDNIPESYFYTAGNDLNFTGAPGGFPIVMEWGETADSLDVAVRIVSQCGQIGVGAYHTGEKRPVDVQALNVKAIDMLSTHPRETDIMRRAYHSIIRMLSDKTWNYQGLPTKVYPISRFDQAHEELETKFGTFMKSVVLFTDEDFEPYIVNGENA